MNSILGGIAIMLLVAVVAGFGLQSTFSQSAGDVNVSQNGSVRLD